MIFFPFPESSCFNPTQGEDQAKTFKTQLFLGTLDPARRFTRPCPPSHSTLPAVSLDPARCLSRPFPESQPVRSTTGPVRCSDQPGYSSLSGPTVSPYYFLVYQLMRTPPPQHTQDSSTFSSPELGKLIFPDFVQIFCGFFILSIKRKNWKNNCSHLMPFHMYAIFN